MLRSNHSTKRHPATAAHPQPVAAHNPRRQVPAESARRGHGPTRPAGEWRRASGVGARRHCRAARAEELATLFADLGLVDRVLVEEWDKRAAALEGKDLLVNTSSLGMIGQPALEISLDALPATALVTDIVYNPLKTDLLAAARARGNGAVDGLGMLLHQAVPGFEHWFGPRPSVTKTLRSLILEA